MSGSGPSNAVHNERMKLSATFLNTIGSATVVVGGITPLAALAYGMGTITREVWLAVALAVCWIAAGVGLHFVGRAILGLMKP